LPIYCFDPRFNEKKVPAFGIRKCGAIRTKFMIESVAVLRYNLEALGSGLLVTRESPEEFLRKVTGPGKTTIVYQ
jgi:hypothetical protein